MTEELKNKHVWHRGQIVAAPTYALEDLRTDLFISFTHIRAMQTPPSIAGPEEYFLQEPLKIKSINNRDDRNRTPGVLCIQFAYANDPTKTVTLTADQIIKIAHDLRELTPKSDAEEGIKKQWNTSCAGWNAQQFAASEGIAQILGYKYDRFIDQKLIENLYNGKADYENAFQNYLTGRQTREPKIQM